MPIIGTAPNKTFQRSDGTRTGAAVNVQAKAAGVKNTAALADVRENDHATAINIMVMRDGGNQPTANLPMNGYRHTGVGAAEADSEYCTYGQMTSYVIAAVLPVGVKMVFAQAAAPAGWTMDTANDDKALRVVAGATGGSAGGTTAFSAAWTSVAMSGSVHPHTLTAAEMPVHHHTGTTGDDSPDHTHGTLGSNAGAGGTGGNFLATQPVSTGGASVKHQHPFTTGDAGSGNAHDHGLTVNAFTVSPKYLDVIVCTKD